MISLKNRTTKNLNKFEIEQICKLKNTEWRFGLNSQKSWFKKNVKPNDKHNLLLFKKKICGYTCLRKRTYSVNNKKYKYLYFDTLIIKNSLRKTGLGKLLMIYNNYIIKKNKLPTFLVCRNKTLKFYKNNDWKKINNQYYKILDNKFPKQHGMIFNENLFKKNNKLLLWTKK